jgi:hypothetical protein
MKAGEQLQYLIQILERVTVDSPNVKIESPKRLPDKDTGRLREHDVVLTFSMKHHKMIVALECRDRNREVGVPEVEAFKSKCDRTGISRGVIVSSRGFTKTGLLKAKMMGIDCFGLNEIERFNWCQAPGIECMTREIVEGPSFVAFPATPVTTEPALYDDQGRCLDAQRLRGVVIDCLNKRPPEIAAEQDAAAAASPVGIRFIDHAPSAWHVLDADNQRVPLVRLEVTLKYRIRVSLVPFNFRQYFDHSADKEIYTAALAPIDAGDIQGEIVLHRVEGKYIEVVFVPKQVQK